MTRLLLNYKRQLDETVNKRIRLLEKIRIFFSLPRVAVFVGVEPRQIGRRKSGVSLVQEWLSFKWKNHFTSIRETVLASKQIHLLQTAVLGDEHLVTIDTIADR